MTKPTLLDRIGDNEWRTHWLELVLVAHVALYGHALSQWPDLSLSPKGQALVDAVTAWPNRSALVALRFADMCGDVRADHLEELHDMATVVDSLTIGDIVAVGSLDTLVHWLHAERLLFRKAA